MEKDYVGLAYKICPICGNKFESGEVLLDKHLRKSLERETVIGYGLCKEHQKLFNEDYLGLIEVSNVHKKDTLKFEDAERTGNIMHIKKEFFKALTGTDQKGAFLFIDVEAFNKIKEIYEKETGLSH